MSIKSPKYQEDSAEGVINISPLIDVLFILLIFFIVTMVFSDRNAIDIDSPTASNVSIAKENMLISIDKSGFYFYNNKKLSLKDLEMQCLQLSKQKNLVLILEADATAPVQSVVSLIDISKTLGIEEVYVVADKK